MSKYNAGKIIFVDKAFEQLDKGKKASISNPSNNENDEFISLGQCLDEFMAITVDSEII